MSADPSSAALKARLAEFLAAGNEFPKAAACLDAIELSLRGACLEISFAHPYFAAFYRSHCQRDFEAACRACFGPVAFAAATEAKQQAAPPLARPRRAGAFSDFIADSKNKAALAAAQGLCEAREPLFQLLILHGPSGSGKSHLLNLISAAIASAKGAGSCAKHRAAAFQPHGNPESYWSRPRALLLDDAQELAGDAQAQERIATHIEAAKNSGHWARLAMASSEAEAAIYAPRLRRRVEAGLCIEMHPAGLAARMAYVEKKAAELALELNKRQIAALARHARAISALDGLLQKLSFHASLSGRAISPEELEKLALPSHSTPGWQRILMRVAEKLEVKPAEIMGRSRKSEITLARQIAMHLCRASLGLSYPELGRIFGGKDHATVMHGIKKIQRLREVDKDMRALLTELEQEGD